MTQAIETVKAIFAAFVAKDRALAEALIADELSFTSPYDNGIDRAAYFEICWPNSEWMSDVQFARLAESDGDGDGDGDVFVTYEATTTSGKRFRNTEMLAVRSGKITAIEVYFGWNVPHEVQSGLHKSPQ